MNNIQNYIADIPDDTLAFITENKKYYYSDLKKLYLSNKSTIGKLKNSCVVIHARDRIEFALLLSILDGNVSRIVFVPKDIDNSLLDQYYKDSGVNYEVFLEQNILKLEHISDEQLESSGVTQWIIPTSGTTNVPKLVAHTFDSLSKSLKKDINVGSRYVWGLTYDIYRFSGIQVFLQAILGGSSIIISEGHYSIKNAINLFVKNNCNIISATPSFWRKVLMMPESSSLALKRATLGGEISDKSVLKALKNKFDGIKVTHIYASTEVGVGFAVTDGFAGFPYSYIENGIGKIQLKIDEESILWINPGKQIQNYIAKNSMYDENGFINTGDIVRVDGDRVYFLGRDSGAINVGGNKVQPEEVEAELLASGLVSSACVYPKQNPMMGSLVCADIVPIDLTMDKSILKKQVIEYCRNKMEKFKVPAILTVVVDLEITQSGKIKRG